MEAILLTNLGSLELNNDLTTGVTTTLDALDVSRELHWHQGVRIALINLSNALMATGEWALRDELLDTDLTDRGSMAYAHIRADSTHVALARGLEPDLLDPAELPRHPVSQASARLANATIRAARDETDGLTEEVLAIAEMMQEDLGFQFDFTDWLQQAGDVLLAIGATDALADVLAAHAAGVPASPPAVRAAYARHTAHLARFQNGPSGEVADGLRDAIAILEGWGARTYAQRARAELADVLDAIGEVDEAAALRIPVRAFYAEIGATAWLAELTEDGVARLTEEPLAAGRRQVAP